MGAQVISRVFFCIFKCSLEQGRGDKIRFALRALLYALCSTRFALRAFIRDSMVESL